MRAAALWQAVSIRSTLPTEAVEPNVPNIPADANRSANSLATRLWPARLKVQRQDAVLTRFLVPEHFHEPQASPTRDRETLG
jgi:hypothetical protein